jgi:hypothetical protein
VPTILVGQQKRSGDAEFMGLHPLLLPGAAAPLPGLLARNVFRSCTAAEAKSNS